MYSRENMNWNTQIIRVLNGWSKTGTEAEKCVYASYAEVIEKPQGLLRGTIAQLCASKEEPKTIFLQREKSCNFAEYKSSGHALPWCATWCPQYPKMAPNGGQIMETIPILNNSWWTCWMREIAWWKLYGRLRRHYLILKCDVRRLGKIKNCCRSSFLQVYLG